VIWGLQTLLVALVLVLPVAAGHHHRGVEAATNIIAVLVTTRASMAISEDGVTREAQAVKALQNGVLASLNRSFQTRLYRVDSASARYRQPSGSPATAPSTRIGDSLKQFSEETSDLPIGAIVLLSDGDDNSGGIGGGRPSARCASHHIPVHTVASDGSARDMTWNWTMSWLLPALWRTPASLPGSPCTNADTPARRSS